MTAQELMAAQADIDAQVKDQARKLGLASDETGCYPIFDGIADESAYLNSNLKVAWILKEPYDDFDENHAPCGGGWSLVKGCFLEHDENWVTEDGRKQWKNPVWQKIAYVMYGFRHGLHWEDMDWIRDKPSMMDEIKSVAWINLSKMPAQKSSSNGSFAYWYATAWTGIVSRQIEVCRPDVLIFGKTFRAYVGCYGGTPPIRDINLGTEGANVYRAGDQFWIETGHPGRKGGPYVNALIDALNKIQARCKNDPPRDFPRDPS